MKTLRFIGMALVAVILSVSFIACSDDEDDANTSPTTGKRLVRLTCNEDIAYFNYGSNGWLNQVTFTDDDPLNVSYENQTAILTWGGEYPELEGEYVYDNLLRSTKYKNDSKSCTYDAEGHLVKLGNRELVWENGNVVSYKRNEYGGTETFTYYTDKENKHYSFISDPVFFIDGSYFFAAHPQLLGKMSKNLVKTCDMGEYLYTYTYETDQDGYITKVTKTSSDGEVTTYTMTWK